MFGRSSSAGVTSAAAAADAADQAGYLAKMEAAVALRPDFPRMLVNLAAAQLANARADDAIATLEKLAALGAHSPVEKSAEFGALRGQKEFSAIVKKLAANLYPKGDGEIAFKHTSRGLPENVQAVADLGLFEFAQVGVEFAQVAVCITVKTCVFGKTCDVREG